MGAPALDRQNIEYRMYQGLSTVFSFMTLLFKLDLINSRLTLDVIKDLELAVAHNAQKLMDPKTDEP